MLSYCPRFCQTPIPTTPNFHCPVCRMDTKEEYALSVNLAARELFALVALQNQLAYVAISTAYMWMIFR